MEKCRNNLHLVALISVLGLSACGETTEDPAAAGANRTVGVIKTITSNGENVSGLNVSGINFDVSNVNGVKGDDVSQLNQLEPGMVVSVTGTVDKMKDTGVANDISYDAKIKGIVDSPFANGELGVMGQVVVVTDTTVFKSNVEGITLETIPLDAVVEVSGFMNDEGKIVATRIKVKVEQMDASEELEIEGEISNLSMISETEGSFNIGEYLVNYDANTLYDDILDNVLADGMFVEVHLMMDELGNITAVKIEAEYGDDMNDDDSENGEIKLVGTVTSEGVVDGKFELDGLSIMLGENVEYEHGSMEDIVIGAVLEVEAYLNTEEMMVAREIEFAEMDDEEEVERKGTVTSVGVVDGQFELDGEIIMLGENVEYDNGSMEDIVEGVMLEVEGYLNIDGILVATEIEFEEMDMDEVKLMGMVSSMGVVDGKFELNGEMITLGDNVNYRNGDMTDIVNGAMLEVKAYFDVDQMLVASKIEFLQVGDEFNMSGMVTSEGVVDGVFELDGKSIALDMDTMYNNGDMTNIVNGAKLEAKVYLNAENMLVATKIKFEEAMSAPIM